MRAVAGAGSGAVMLRISVIVCIAAIFTSGLLGEQYVGLEAGAEDDALKDGDKIESTQGAVVLEKLISQFLYNKASEGGSNSNSKNSDKKAE
jgi:phospholipid/cholesterol/gamma-HCH transport system substrate-binding protein